MKDYEWDEAKAEANRAKHGVAFESIVNFEWDTAIEYLDDREEYGEDRFIAIGFIGVNLHVAVYTPRGHAIRLIGLRKAKTREIRRYAQTQTRPH